MIEELEVNNVEGELTRTTIIDEKDRYQILLGTLLGDAYISKEYGVLGYTHNSKFKDYALWKSSIFDDFSYVERKRYDKRTSKVYFNVDFYSKGSTKYNKYRKDFYEGSKKCKIPEYVFSDLSDLGVAVLFQDDGSLYYNGDCCHLNIAINRFGEENIEKFIKWFKDKYDLNFKITSSNGIRLTSIKEIEKFESYFKRYYHETMNYKTLEFVRNKHTQRLQEHVKLKRTLVLTDLHGNLKALKQCLERCNFDVETDRLIFLGDENDGYGDSYDMIEYLISLSDSCFIEPVFIRGNHSKWLMDWLETNQADPIWHLNGGTKTIEDYTSKEVCSREEHLNFLKKQKNYYIDDDRRLFIHGGFTSEEGVGFENEDVYYNDRDLWEKYCMTNTLWKGLLNYKEIFIGHTATINWVAKPHYPEYHNKNQKKGAPITVPMNRHNVWNLDTGGGMEGKVTIMDVDTKEYWQSDYCKDLYKSYTHR